MKIQSCNNARLDPIFLHLPFGENIRRKNTSPWNLLERLSKVQPGHELTKTLESGLVSAEWEVYRSYRNTMTHRSNIPRITYGAVGSTPPPEKIMQFADTWSTKGMHAGEEEFERLFEWLAFFLKDILRGGVALAKIALTSE